MKEQTLELCAHCGGEGELIIGFGLYKYHVCCKICEARAGGTAYKNDEYNIKAWNTRTITKEQVLEAVELDKYAIRDIICKEYEKDDLDCDIGKAIAQAKDKIIKVRTTNKGGK